MKIQVGGGGVLEASRESPSCRWRSVGVRVELSQTYTYTSLMYCHCLVRSPIQIALSIVKSSSKL